MKRIFRYSYILIFSLLISVIGISTLLKFGRTDPAMIKKIERRNPAVMPEFSLKADSIDQFFTGLDTYVNDFFSFRSDMIQAYTAMIYKMGASANPNRIVLGKDDYLFQGNSFNRVVDHVEGKMLFSENQLRQWLLKFSHRKQYLDMLNIPFYVVVIPTKHVMYTESLPDYIVPSPVTNMTQILNNHPDFKLVYLKDTLENAKKEWGKLLYYKSDSHWSEIGAYISYLKIMNWLKQDFEKLKPIRLASTEFTIEPHTGWQNKHLLRLTLDLDDFNADIVWNEKWDTTMIKTTFKGDTLPFNYNQEITYQEKVIVHNDDKPYTLLLLEDSFSVKLSPYLNQSFGKVIYCHYNDDAAREMTQLVKRFQPDLVLYELGEQSLFLHQDAHPNVINEITKKKYQLVKSWDGKQLFDEIKSYHQITDVSVKNGDLCLKATGNDPGFRLPVTNLSKGKYTQINIKLTSPGKTSAQIFFVKPDGTGYSGKNAVTISVTKGKNKLSFHLPVKHLADIPVRFDPGSLPGRYMIHSVEFLQGNP